MRAAADGGVCGMASCVITEHPANRGARAPGTDIISRQILL